MACHAWTVDILVAITDTMFPGTLAGVSKRGSMLLTTVVRYDRIIRSNHQTEIEELGESHKADSKKARESHDKIVAQYKADKGRTLTAHQESMAERQRAHNAQMRSQKSGLEAKHQEAINKADQDHDAQMDRQKSDLTAKHLPSKEETVGVAGLRIPEHHLRLLD